MSEREHLHAAVKELLNRVFNTSDDDWSWEGEAEIPNKFPHPTGEVAARRADGEGPKDVPTPPLRGTSPVGRGNNEEVAAGLAAISAEVHACRKCPLGSTRLKPAFGVGNPHATVMFVGEGPGFEEDHRGEPFVGKAGQLLDKIIASIGLSRETVYIANIVKCHPMVDPSDPEKRGNDRPPDEAEMAACRSYLDRQIAAIRPKFIVTLGNVSTKNLLGTTKGIKTLRGKWQDLNGIRLLPTYHPAALLRDPNLKKEVWEDMKSLKAELANMGE